MVMDKLPEGEKESDGKEENASLSNAQLFRKLALLKLKLVVGYAMDGFAPAVAVVAVIVAVIAMNGNKADQTQLTRNAATIESMKASMLASKAEQEKLKGSLLQEKAMHEEERKKQNERMTQIIQSVSKLQVKMKISPTLEDQLRQPLIVSATTPAVAMPPANPVILSPKPATASVSTGNDKKPAAHMDALKESIEKFNKK